MIYSKGFTLLELLFTISISAVLLSLSVPAFTQMISRNQVLSTANDLLSDIQLARSEAIKSGNRVSICHSNNSETCSGSWSDGWIVYRVDNNVVITVRGKMPRGLTLKANSKIKDYLSYLPSGRARSNSNALQNGTFTVKQDDYTYRVIIANSGRPRVKSI